MHAGFSVNARTIREFAYYPPPAATQGAGERTDIDRTLYHKAIAFIRAQPTMTRTRVVMRHFGFRLHGGGREQFLRTLLRLDLGIFSSDNDEWVGDCDRHYVEGSGELRPQKIKKVRRRRRTTGGQG